MTGNVLSNKQKVIYTIQVSTPNSIQDSIPNEITLPAVSK